MFTRTGSLYDYSPIERKISKPLSVVDVLDTFSGRPQDIPIMGNSTNHRTIDYVILMLLVFGEKMSLCCHVTKVFSVLAQFRSPNLHRGKWGHLKLSISQWILL